MKPCPACGRSTSDTARSCEYCGAPVTDVPDDLSELAPRVRRLLADGQKIDAIKVVREATGAGLAEAKSAVEAIERGSLPELSGLDDAFEQELLALLQAGQKIEAIKRYRNRTHSGQPGGLKEAKEFVEALGRQHGIVPPRGGCAGVVLGLMIAFLIAATCLAQAMDAAGSSGHAHASTAGLP